MLLTRVKPGKSRQIVANETVGTADVGSGQGGLVFSGDAVRFLKGGERLRARGVCQSLKIMPHSLNDASYGASQALWEDGELYSCFGIGQAFSVKPPRRRAFI